MHFSARKFLQAGTVKGLKRALSTTLDFIFAYLCISDLSLAIVHNHPSKAMQG